MKGSGFIFDSADVLYYDLNKIGLNRGGPYKDYPKWLKNKKSTINPTTSDNKWFQYAITVSLNNDQIKSHPEILTKIKPFINQNNWK